MTPSATLTDCGRNFDTVSNTVSKPRPQSEKQTADAISIPVSKPRPQLFLKITKSGPRTALGSHPVKGRTADRRRPQWTAATNRPARSRVRPTYGQTSVFVDRRAARSLITALARSFCECDEDKDLPRTATHVALIARVRMPTPCAGGGCPRAQCFRVLSCKPLCTPLATRHSRTLTAKKDKYLTSGRLHASATRACFRCIWPGRKSSLVCRSVRR
jgi:hypothetical protein